MATFKEFDGELDGGGSAPAGKFSEFSGELDGAETEAQATTRRNKENLTEFGQDLKRRFVGEHPLDELKAGVKALPANMVTLGDMVLSLPAQALQVGAYPIMRTRAVFGGDADAKTAGQTAAKFASDISEPFANPMAKTVASVSKVMEALGYQPSFNGDFSSTDVMQAMEKAQHFVGKGGEFVERHSAGLFTKEDVDALANTVLFAVGGKQTAATVDPKLAAMGRVKAPVTGAATAADAEFLRKQPGPEAPAAEPVTSAAKIDEALGIRPEGERAAAGKARRGEVRAAFGENPGEADYWAFKAQERASNEAVQKAATEKAAVENPAAEKAVPETNDPATLYVDPEGVALPKELMDDPGTQAAVRRFVATKGQRGAIDAKELEGFIRGLGFDNADKLAGSIIAGLGKLPDVGPIERQMLPESQRGAINAKVFDEGFSAKKAIGDDLNLEMSGTGEAAMIVVKKGAETVGKLRIEPLDYVGMDPKSNARAGWVEVSPAYRGKGLTEQMYKFAAEQGNDIEASGSQTGAAKKMWDRFEQEGVSTGRVIPRGQRGAIDAGDAAKLAGVAGAAAVGSQLSDDPIFGGLVGGLGAAGAGWLAAKGLKGAGTAAGKAVAGLDDLLGNVSTRIRNISPAALQRARSYELGVSTRVAARLKESQPFAAELAKVKGPAADELARAMLTNDPVAVRSAIEATGNSKLLAEWGKVAEMLQSIGKDAKEAGLISNLRENYFPRRVKDLDGLLTQLSAPLRGNLQKALADAEAASIRQTGVGLSDFEQAALINRKLEGAGSEGRGRPGFSRQRQIAVVTKELQPFYEAPATSLHNYVIESSKAIERAKFFGKDLVKVAREGGGETVDLNASIGNTLLPELKAGKISPDQYRELHGILMSRFVPGDRATAGALQDARNLMNAGLLGNVVAAASQIGDVAITAATQGLRPTFDALVQQATGRTRVNLNDFGLSNHVAEEFGSTRASASFLNKALKWGLFDRIDALGKNTALNAALSKFTSQAKTVGGLRALESRFGESFGSDYPALVQELKSGKIGEQTRMALFSELSDLQPVSRLEVPKAYLDHPNGRLLYMLKTYQLKQLDILRSRVIDQMRKGDIRGGLGNLTKISTAFGVGGATSQWIQNWLLGRETDFEAMDIPMNLLKTFGWSEYVLDKARKGDALQAFAGNIVPPYKMFDDMLNASGAFNMSEKSLGRARDKVVSYLPVLGRLIESHELGGAERFNEYHAKQKAKAEK